jgi:DNA-directed RNA polymerase subunit RPC12/RpoP
MSIQRRRRPGDDTAAYCTRCKRDFTHTILAMADERTPERVRCNTCGSEHRYIPERAAGTAARPSSSHDVGRVPAMRTAREEIDAMEPDELVAALRDLIAAAGSVPETRIGAKWEGGTLVLKPGKPGLQEKEVPVEAFFKKIVMVRDRLRVLEQRVNSSESLSDAEKLDLQQYITRCYGSLTTFNALFDSREDWFVGEKKSEG